MKNDKLDQRNIWKDKELIKQALDAQIDTFFLFEYKTGKVLLWNKCFSEITGYSDEEISQMKAPDSYYGKADLIKTSNFIKKIVINGSGKIELDLKCKDGKKVPTEYNVSLIKDNVSKPKYLISVGRNITERKDHELALKESEDKFMQFIDTVPAIAFIKDSNSKAVYINNYMDEVLGNKEWLNKPLKECVPPEIAEQMIKDDKEALEKKYKKIIEHVPDKLGRIKIFETHKFRIDIRKKEPLLGGIAIDITAQQQAEKEVREQGKMLENIINHSNEIFFVHDTNNVISYVSRGSTKIMGYTPDEMKVNWTSLATDNPLNNEGFKKTEEAIKTGKKQSPYLLEVRQKSGKLIFVEIDESPILDENENTISLSGAVRDVSKRIKAEEKVKKQQEHLEDLIKERTGDLEEKNKELERLNKLFIGREFRIKELRDKITELEEKLENQY